MIFWCLVLKNFWAYTLFKHPPQNNSSSYKQSLKLKLCRVFVLLSANAPFKVESSEQSVVRENKAANQRDEMLFSDCSDRF